MRDCGWPAAIFSSVLLSQAQGSMSEAMRTPGDGTLVMTGEIVTGIEISIAWFAHGLRIMDIKNPHSPCETTHFIPDVPAGCDRGFSNDVTVDACGLIYFLDRQREVYDVIAPGEPSHERCNAILSP